MSAILSQSPFLEGSSPRAPFYAESPEISRQLFKAATTPRSFRSSNSPSRIFESYMEDDIFAPSRDKGKGKARANSREAAIPSGFGLGLGIPVLPRDGTTTEEPLVAWRFSEMSKPTSTVVSPGSPSPTESVDGDAAPVPPSDQGSVYTLTPGPAWPPPPSTEVSPDPTPRSSLDASVQQGSGYSTDSEDMPLSPLTLAMTQLPSEIKPVTTVQAWVRDMPSLEPVRGRGESRVRKMRSWRNLRALGTRTSQFDLLRKTGSSHTLPSPPITPPAGGVVYVQVERAGRGADDEEEERRGRQGGGAGYVRTTQDMQLPDSPVENPFYDDYEDIIEAHLSPREEDEMEVEVQPGEEEEQELAPVAPPPTVSEPLVVAPVPITPDPNSDLVSEIEALLRSSPLRKKKKQDGEATSEASTPTRDRGIEGADENTPKPIQHPTFNRNATEESLVASETTNDTVFFTPTETRTALGELNAFENDPLPPPIPPKAARPQTPPVKVVASSSSTHSTPTPTRHPIPTRTSSLSHSRNGSTEAVPTKSYPPTSHRPGAHLRGKSIDSSSVYNDRGRTYPVPTQHQRSSSANAVSDEAARGRGRSRSIDDGPPPIPVRRSSVGKAGRPTDLLQNLLGRKGEAASTPQAGPSQAPPAADREEEDEDEDMELPNGSRFSFSSGVEVLGVGEQAELVSADVVRSGSVKEVLVRTGSKGTKASEFPGAPSSSTLSSRAEVKKPAKPIQQQPQPQQPQQQPQQPQRVPQFSFGEGPDLTLGESSPTAAEKGKGKERATDQTFGFSPLPVTFQLIPPTPAADEAGARTRQLGYKPIPIPLSLVGESSGSGSGSNSNSGSPPMRQATPNPLAGVPVIHVNSASDSMSSVPLPPRMPSVVNEINGQRPATAPEPLIDFENTTPASPKRPSLKTMPTGFKKSKLSPWWQPKRGVYEPRFHNYNDGYEDGDGEREFHEVRPHTSGFASTAAGGGRKKPRTMSLGKVQVEFLGMKWFRESLRERKEYKKQRKALQNRPPVVDAGPPRLEVRF
ncbi:hypothetical protein DRE_01552 [Drechslerella stenobrocha 248]|uniref:Uncharacterized protein n=1 Tax=Drechslerella stenobrocha 248 TaxID=1043628 RepID=W7I4K2_9PEZI|nr:hypothetical protein DRE_01552 [Drechslerella stenobrocha 248]